GYSPMFASWALGVLGGSSIGFTVMLGALSDRFGRRPVLAAIYAGRILIFAGFFLIRDNPMAILVVAVLGGITMAGTGSMTSALNRRMLVNPAANAMADIGMAVSSIRAFARCTRRVVATAVGEAPAWRRNSRRRWRAVMPSVSARPSTVPASSRNPRSMSRSA